MNRISCNRHILVILVFGFLMALPGMVRAETTETSTATENAPAKKESPYGSASANVNLTTDYVFRGQTQTNHLPAVQGGLDWTHPTGFYLGAWGSNVHFPEAPQHLEVDEYGGYSYSFNDDLSTSLGIYHYSYFPGAEINTVDYPFQVAYKSARLGVNYAPHWGGSQNSNCWYVSGGWGTQLPLKLNLALAAGYSLFGADSAYEDYADFHIGLSRELMGVKVDVSGYFVNHQQPTGTGYDDPRAVFSASKTL